MALDADVVVLVGLHLLDDTDQVGTGGGVTVVEQKARVTLMETLVDVIDSNGVLCEAFRRPQLLARRLMPCTT